jgi:hypothetical protein
VEWQPLPDPQWVYVKVVQGAIYCWCEVCEAQSGPTNDEGLDAFATAHVEHQSASPSHMGLGDAATPLLTQLGKALGIEHCTPCERRRMALNNMMPSVPFTRRR